MCESHLTDGVFVSQIAVRARAHVHVRWEVVTFDLQPRTVGHVEVETPEDGRAVLCRETGRQTGRCPVIYLLY